MLAGDVLVGGNDQTGFVRLKMVRIAKNLSQETLKIMYTCTYLCIGSRENSHTFGKPNYFESVQKEHLACRENVALFDLSPFVKIEIEVSQSI